MPRLFSLSRSVSKPKDSLLTQSKPAHRLPCTIRSSGTTWSLVVKGGPVAARAIGAGQPQLGSAVGGRGRPGDAVSLARGGDGLGGGLGSAGGSREGCHQGDGGSVQGFHGAFSKVGRGCPGRQYGHCRPQNQRPISGDESGRAMPDRQSSNARGRAAEKPCACAKPACGIGARMPALMRFHALITPMAKPSSEISASLNTACSLAYSSSLASLWGVAVMISARRAPSGPFLMVSERLTRPMKALEDSL